MNIAELKEKKLILAKQERDEWQSIGWRNGLKRKLGKLSSRFAGAGEEEPGEAGHGKYECKNPAHQRAFLLKRPRARNAPSARANKGMIHKGIEVPPISGLKLTHSP